MTARSPQPQTLANCLCNVEGLYGRHGWCPVHPAPLRSPATAPTEPIDIGNLHPLPVLLDNYASASERGDGWAMDVCRDAIEQRLAASQQEVARLKTALSWMLRCPEHNDAFEDVCDNAKRLLPPTDQFGWTGQDTKAVRAALTETPQ